MFTQGIIAIDETIQRKKIFLMNHIYSLRGESLCKKNSFSGRGGIQHIDLLIPLSCSINITYNILMLINLIQIYSVPHFVLVNISFEFFFFFSCMCACMSVRGVCVCVECVYIKVYIYTLVNVSRLSCP